MPRRTHLGAGGTLVVALSLVVGGCSLPGSGPDAGDAADRLAKGLTKGSLSSVAFTGDDKAAETSYATITKGVSGAKVSVGRVSTDDDLATVRLGWQWSVGSKTWRYDTDVRLQKAATSDGDQWLVRWAPTVVEPSLKDGERLTLTGLKAKRGDVLGAGGSSLVTLRPVLRVGLDKEKVPAGQVPDAARSLARLVGVDAASYGKQVAATGARAFVEAIVYRRGDVPPRVLAGLTAIPGARAISDRLPLAPSKDFAGAILGTVGPATAEIVKDSKGRVHAGDDVGLSGLQRRYDETLAGTRGEEVVAVKEEDQRRVLFTAAPVDGKALRTTIDPRLQTLAQGLLADVGPASALVAVKPSTGALVAVASGPGSKGYNTATYGRYAPGSTFKIVSALALLRAGETPATTVPCTPTTVVDGKQFKNYSDYPSSELGRITLETALANSCNTAFVSQRDKLGPTSLSQAAAALGLGVDHDTGFPSYFGEVGRAGSETQAAASMIGQGAVLASPMAMATVVASVLRGSTVLPRLLPDVKADPKQPEKPLTAAEARALRTMMRAVVERGSGTRLAGLPGNVIAKTGTAEFGDKPPLPTHAWMVAGRGDLAVAVFVDRGQSGSQTAGPILQSFLEKGEVSDYRTFQPVDPQARPVRHRRTARVLLVDERERILLFEDSDPGLSGRHWWITPGGGVEGDETDFEGAVRELQEETGLVTEVAALAGPVARRTVHHGYTDVVVVQEEVFFGLVVAPFDIDVSGHTEEEQVTMTRHRWWTRQELATTEEEVWPVALLELWDRFESGAPEVDLGQQEESTVPVNH